MTRLTPAPPAGELIDSPPFPKAAPVQLANPVQRKNLHHAMTTIRTKRANVVAEKADWEAMRVAGAQIKDRTLRHLDTYLLQLEESLQRNGVHVHWATDADDANRIVREIVDERLAREDAVAAPREVVKVKSMATQEIELNEAL